MQPTKIALQNFLSYGDTEVDFNGLHLAALLGHNGAGKSSLVDAITWPLYGEGRYKDIDKYIRQGQENAAAELQFSLGEESYRVIRTRSNKGKGKSTLELAKLNGAGWEPLIGSSIRETQDKIRDLLRMDYDTFVSSCVLLQGEADRFSQATSSERLRIFSQILGLDIYDRLLDAARTYAKAYRVEAAQYRAKLDNLDQELSVMSELQSKETDLKSRRDTAAARVTELENKLVTLENTVSGLRVKASKAGDLKKREQQLEIDISSMEDQIRGIEPKRNRLNTILKHADQIRQKAKELEEVKAQTADLDDKASRERELSRKADELEKQVAAFDSNQEKEIARINSQIESKESQAKLLDGVPCSGSEKESCQLLASARAAAEEIPALEQRLSEAEGKQNPYVDDWQTAAKARDEVGYDPDAHRRLKERLPKLEEWARGLTELEHAEEAIKELDQQAGQLKNRFDELGKELKGIKEKLQGMEQVTADLRGKEAELFGARQQLKEAQEEDRDLAVQLGTVQARIKDLADKQQEKKLIEKETTNLIREEHYYTRLSKAYKEIPVLIMENALPDVEELANELLGRLTGGRVSVRFETQKEAKTTGNVSDTLDIFVSDDLGERPYEGWSGAERFDVDLAIRLAISKFLAKRAGTKIELLVIDEGMSCLDHEGRQHFVEAVHAIADQFKLILCITHIDELKESLPQQLLVEKTPEGSRLEVVT